MSEWGEFARLCYEIDQDNIRSLRARKCRKCEYQEKCIPEICDAGEYDD